MNTQVLNDLVPTTGKAVSATWRGAWRLIACIALTALLTANAFAQGNGRLAGRVDETAAGRALEGVTVQVQGTNLRGVTDTVGRYVINAVPVGDYTVTFNFVGYEQGSYEVSVESGETVTLNATLTSLNVLEEITVLGVRTGAGRAINMQKTAAGIVNVVSEEQFGAMVDGNIGQALQRLPGLSVDQSQDGSQGSINIRGIAGEFNSVQIDGNRVPSSGGSNSFNPRQLAADSVTLIEVIKAPTPDRDGDAIGGIVNLVSRSAFQRKGRETSVMVGGTMNSISDKWSPNATVDYSDIFSVGEGENNLGLSFSLSSYKTDRYSENADQDWIQVDPATNPELDLEGYNKPVWFMESRDGYRHRYRVRKRGRRQQDLRRADTEVRTWHRGQRGLPGLDRHAGRRGERTVVSVRRRHERVRDQHAELRPVLLHQQTDHQP